MFNLRTLPRASWKARLFILVLMAFPIFMAVDQWPNLHNNLTVVRWYAWINEFISLNCLWLMLPVVVFGRVPRSISRLPRALTQTFGQTRAEIAAESKERRDRSREL